MKNKAFTLIELLVVIAIISLLSTFIISSLSDSKSKAKNSHRESDGIEIKKAIELHRLDFDDFVPMFSNSTLTNKLHPEDSTEYQEAMAQLVNNGYLSRIPLSPSGNDYGYIVSNDRKSGVFYINQDESVGGEDVCKYIGSDNFGQTGTGETCDGVIYPGTGNPTYCGEPPYIISTPSYSTINITSLYPPILGIVDQVYAEDPEGESVIFSLTDYYFYPSNFPTDYCSLNQSGYMYCEIHDSSQIMNIDFSYYTNGCPEQHASIQIDYVADTY